MTGHAGPVRGVCALPGWKGEARSLLATAGYDGTLRLWDPTAGTAVGMPMTGHTGAAFDVCALLGAKPDGRGTDRTLLATAGDDGSLRVWDPVTRTAVGQPLTGAPNTVAALAPGASRSVGCVTVNADGAVRAWDPATASYNITPAPLCTSAAFTLPGPGGGVLLTGDMAGYVHVTDLACGEVLGELMRVDDGAVLALCRLPAQPTRVAAAGRSGTIIILRWTGGGFSVERVLGSPRSPVRALCTVDAAGARDRPGGLWGSLAGRGRRQRSDRPLLLAAAGNHGSIQLWNLDTWIPHGQPLTGHHGWVWSLTALPGQADTPPRLASAGADQTIRLWDPLGCRRVGEPFVGHTDQVRAVTWVTSTDGRGLLVSGGHDGTVRLWHPTTGAAIHTIPLDIPVHALLPQPPDSRGRQRTDGGATITVGLRTGILSLDIHESLFPLDAQLNQWRLGRHGAQRRLDEPNPPEIK